AVALDEDSGVRHDDPLRHVEEARGAQEDAAVLRRRVGAPRGVPARAHGEQQEREDCALRSHAFSTESTGPFAQGRTDGSSAYLTLCRLCYKPTLPPSFAIYPSDSRWWAPVHAGIPTSG